jgi:hypothetical protein
MPVQVGYDGAGITKKINPMVERNKLAVKAIVSTRWTRQVPGMA